MTKRYLLPRTRLLRLVGAKKKGALDLVILNIYDIAALEKFGDMPASNDAAKFRK